MLFKNQLFLGSFSLLLTSCNQLKGSEGLPTQALEDIGSDKVRVLDSFIFGPNEGANPGDPGSDDHNNDPIVNPDPENPIVEEKLDVCPAVTLAKTLNGSEPATKVFKGVSSTALSKTLRYQIFNEAGTRLKVGGPTKISATYELYFSGETRVQFDDSVINLLKSHNLFSRSAALFKGVVHFCTVSEACNLDSFDRVFSLKINEKTFLSRRDALNLSEARKKIFDQTDFEMEDGKVCQIDMNPSNSPLAIDLGRGILLSDPSQVSTLFDFDGDGTKEATSCLQEGAYLSLVNTAGQVENIHQLFGNHTVGPDGKTSENGFEALTKFDSNNDGIIDTRDSVFSALKLWKDDNCDGISQDKELQGLVDAQINSIDLQYVNMFELDHFGNETKQRSVVKQNDGQLKLIVDLWLADGSVNEE